ncbi:DUF4124 domain-containing protein [Salinimonas chungwhensis]|uniref:DUF4124 domain-containing protein n=1 Tax=Salinimonas chungwhensis TaxID=265425 RepID=UPI00038245D7|nr:DUF4124 domain-containing protein [Salinimonas chungwhensis]
MTKTLLFTLTLASLSAPADPGKVYKIEQADGTVIYTDTPSKHSEPVNFDEHTLNVTDALPTPVKDNSQDASQARKQPDYTLSVKRPAPEATIRNNNGKVTITATANPRPTGQFQLTLDGEIIDTNTSGTFALSGVVRGAHTFSIALVNNKGKTLASTSQQTFYMHQASALINNNAGQ